MECKKCGKIIDLQNEKKFCSGCGAPIVIQKPAPRSVTHKRATPYSPVSRREFELRLRTKAFSVAFVASFLVSAITFEIITSSFSVGIGLGLLTGAGVAILFTLIVSRAGLNFKNSLDESTEIVPVWNGLKGALESFFSIFPFLGPLPPD